MSRRKGKCPLDVAKDYIHSGQDPDGFQRLFIDSYKGCGTFTTKKFEKGEFLLEYKGELIRSEEGERRLGKYDTSTGSFVYFFYYQGDHYCIDATVTNGTDLGRYINDNKRKPNAKVKIVQVDGIPHLAVFALRSIEVGDEVEYDYNDPNAFWRKDKSMREIYHCPDGVEKIASKVDLKLTGSQKPMQPYKEKNEAQKGKLTEGSTQSDADKKNLLESIDGNSPKEESSVNKCLWKILIGQNERQQDIVEKPGTVSQDEKHEITEFDEGRETQLVTSHNPSSELGRSQIEKQVILEIDKVIECENTRNLSSVFPTTLSRGISAQVFQDEKHEITEFDEGRETQLVTSHNPSSELGRSQIEKQVILEIGKVIEWENTRNLSSVFPTTLSRGISAQVFQDEKHEITEFDEGRETQLVTSHNPSSELGRSQIEKQVILEIGKVIECENTRNLSSVFPTTLSRGISAQVFQDEKHEITEFDEGRETQLATSHNPSSELGRSQIEKQVILEIDKVIECENTRNLSSVFPTTLSRGISAQVSRDEKHEITEFDEGRETQLVTSHNPYSELGRSQIEKQVILEIDKVIECENTRNLSSVFPTTSSRGISAQVSQDEKHEITEFDEGRETQLVTSPSSELETEVNLKIDKDFFTGIDSSEYYNQVSDSEESRSDSPVFPALTVLKGSSSSDITKVEEHKQGISECDDIFSSESNLKDVNNSGIYMPAILSGRGNNKHKTWNKKHACLFCRTLHTSISKHLRTHRETVEINAVLDLEANKSLENKFVMKEVSLQLQLLKNKGDHQHNLRVLKENKGQLIISRRQTNAMFDSEVYGPCPKCFLWLKESDLYKHKAYRCPFKISDSKPSTGTLITQARILKGSLSGSSTVVHEVFPTMTRDLVSITAQNDVLITALGDEWFRKASRNVLRRRNYASSHMRRAARVLGICRILNPKSSSFMDFIKPCNFDTVVVAAVKAAGIVSETNNDMEHPSVATKFGHDLKRMADTKEAIAIKQSDDKKRKEAEDFLKLLLKEWPSKVAVTAFRIAEERKYITGNKIELPPAEDLKKMSDFLKQELHGLSLEHALSSNKDLYHRTVSLVQARLVMYNKRRPGELEAMRLDSYEKRHTAKDVLRGDIMKDLTTLEQQLYQTHDLVTVRGKRGTPVPVLIPEDTKMAMEFISNRQTRASLLNPDNDNQNFLFANRGRGVFRVCDSLRDLRLEAGVKADLQNPDLLRCTLLRKYMATAVQMLSLDSQEMTWVVKHLGHSVKVHDEYYRLMSSTIERAKIAKLLVLADQGQLGQFQGQSLQELNYDSINIEEKKEIHSVDHGASLTDTTEPEDESIFLPAKEDVSEYEPDEEPDSEEEHPKKKKCYKIVWTDRETKEVEDYFCNLINLKKAPGKAACLTFQEFSKFSANRKRQWEDIKNKVNSVVQRVKRQKKQ